MDDLSIMRLKHAGNLYSSFVGEPTIAEAYLFRSLIKIIVEDDSRAMVAVSSHLIEIVARGIIDRLSSLTISRATITANLLRESLDNFIGSNDLANNDKLLGIMAISVRELNSITGHNYPPIVNINGEQL